MTPLEQATKQNNVRDLPKYMLVDYSEPAFTKPVLITNSLANARTTSHSAYAQGANMGPRNGDCSKVVGRNTVDTENPA